MIIARSRSSMSISGSTSDWPLSRSLKFSRPAAAAVPVEIDRDQIDAALFQRGAPIGLRMQIVVDQRETHFGMIEDVIHVGRAEHGIDRHPDQAGAMNAEQRFDELDRVVADGRNLLAGLQSARDQIIGEAIGVALELGKGHAPLAIGQRDAIRKAPRRALQEIADRHPADAARTRHAAGCCEIGHAVLPQLFVIPGMRRGDRPGDPYAHDREYGFRASRFACPGMTTQCLVPKICRASAGLAISRPARRAQAAMRLDQLAVRCHLGAVGRDRTYPQARCADGRRDRRSADAAARFRRGRSR